MVLSSTIQLYSPQKAIIAVIMALLIFFFKPSHQTKGPVVILILHLFIYIYTEALIS